MSIFCVFCSFFHVRGFPWVSSIFLSSTLDHKHWVALLTELLCMVTWLLSLWRTPNVGFFISFLA